MIQKNIDKSMTYDAFKTLVSKLILEEKSTGITQTEALLSYSILNERRMKRLDKTIKMTNEIKKTVSKIKKELIFLVLMESWCGDGAQTLPVLNKISALSSKIDFKIILRDENENLMKQHLTNGGKAIPKLIILDKANLKVLQTWGPRPSVATDMVVAYQKEHGKLDAEFKKNLQIWYNKDKGISTQMDIVSLLKKLEGSIC